MNAKLYKIQQALKAPKNKNNTFGGFKYRNCEAILEALKPLLDDCTIVLSDEVVSIGGSNYVKATAYLSDGADSVSATAYAREAVIKKGMTDEQLTGSASSYARKYALSGLFGIDDTEDADSQDNRDHTPVKRTMTKDDPVAKAKKELLFKFTERNIVGDAITDALVTVLGKNTVETEQEANEVMQALEDGLI